MFSLALWTIRPFCQSKKVINCQRFSFALLPISDESYDRIFTQIYAYELVMYWILIFPTRLESRDQTIIFFLFCFRKTAIKCFDHEVWVASMIISMPNFWFVFFFFYPLLRPGQKKGRKLFFCFNRIMWWKESTS